MEESERRREVEQRKKSRRQGITGIGRGRVVGGRPRAGVGEPRTAGPSQGCPRTVPRVSFLLQDLSLLSLQLEEPQHL